MTRRRLVALVLAAAAFDLAIEVARQLPPREVAQMLDFNLARLPHELDATEPVYDPSEEPDAHDLPACAASIHLARGAE